MLTLLEKTIIEKKNTLSLSLQQLLLFEDSVSAKYSKVEDIAAAIADFWEYFHIRYDELALIVNLNDESVALKGTTSDLEDTQFSLAISETGDGSFGFYPDPDVQEINFTDLQWYPKWTDNTVITDGIITICADAYASVEDEIYSLSFVFGDPVSYEEASETDPPPATSWTNFSTVRSNILSILTTFHSDIETQLFAISTLYSNLSNIVSDINAGTNAVASSDLSAGELSETLIDTTAKTVAFHDEITAIYNWFDSTFSDTTDKGTTTTEGTIEYWRHRLETLCDVSGSFLLLIHSRASTLQSYAPFEYTETSPVSLFWTKLRLWISEYIDKKNSGSYYVYNNLDTVANTLFDSRDDAYEKAKQIIETSQQYLSNNEWVTVVPIITATNEGLSVQYKLKVIYQWQPIPGATTYTLSRKLYKKSGITEIAVSGLETYLTYQSLNLTFIDDNKVQSTNEYGETIYMPILLCKYTEEFENDEWLVDADTDMTDVFSGIFVRAKIQAFHDSQNLPSIHALPVTEDATLDGLSSEAQLSNAELEIDEVELEI